MMCTWPVLFITAILLLHQLLLVKHWDNHSRQDIPPGGAAPGSCAGGRVRPVKAGRAGLSGAGVGWDGELSKGADKYDDVTFVKSSYGSA